MKENHVLNEDLFNIYAMYELVYEENIKKVLGNVPEYPTKWYRNNNYQEKIDILKEAINNNIPVTETNIYNSNYKSR